MVEQRGPQKLKICYAHTVLDMSGFSSMLEIRNNLYMFLHSALKTVLFKTGKHKSEAISSYINAVRGYVCI